MEVLDYLRAYQSANNATPAQFTAERDRIYSLARQRLYSGEFETLRGALRATATEANRTLRPRSSGQVVTNEDPRAAFGGFMMQGAPSTDTNQDEQLQREWLIRVQLNALGMNDQRIHQGIGNEETGQRSRRTVAQHPGSIPDVGTVGDDFSITESLIEMVADNQSIDDRSTNDRLTETHRKEVIPQWLAEARQDLVHAADAIRPFLLQGRDQTELNRYFRSIDNDPRWHIAGGSMTPEEYNDFARITQMEFDTQRLQNVYPGGNRRQPIEQSFWLEPDGRRWLVEGARGFYREYYDASDPTRFWLHTQRVWSVNTDEGLDTGFLVDQFGADALIPGAVSDSLPHAAPTRTPARTTRNNLSESPQTPPLAFSRSASSDGMNHHLVRPGVEESRNARSIPGRRVMRRTHTDPFTGEEYLISGRSGTQRSQRTTIAADIAETEDYQNLLRSGELGLAAPNGVHNRGPDSVTYNPVDQMIYANDTRVTWGVERPSPKNSTLPSAWRNEASQAAARASFADQRMERRIREAARLGRIQRRNHPARRVPPPSARETEFIDLGDL